MIKFCIIILLISTIFMLHLVVMADWLEEQAEHITGAQAIVDRINQLQADQAAELQLFEEGK